MNKSDRKRRTPVVLISMTVLLAILTSALVGGLAYGFYLGVLTPYWQNLTEPHAAIIAQLLFFLAAAWAAVLVPLLFREQLQTLEDAATRAEATYAEIEELMRKAATDATAQFESITRLQIMSMGYLNDPRQLDHLASPELRKAFVDAAWEDAKLKVDAAIAELNGNKRNSIARHTYRSKDWWEQVKGYDALSDSYNDFKLISDKKNKINLEPTDLRLVNEAARRTQSFQPKPQPEGPVVSTPVTPSPASSVLPIVPPNGDGASQQLPN